MRKLLTILFGAVLLGSCQRSAIPSVTTADSTVVERKDSIAVKDTTIVLPVKTASMATTIDSLKKIIQQLQDENRDTVIRVPRTDSNKDSTLTATIEVKRDGRIIVNCKEDSLKLVIRNLITRYLELFISKQKTKEVTKLVPGPVQIETHIPKWMWWVLAYAICSVGWKIAKLFISPGTSILDILKHWFTKWK